MLEDGKKGNNKNKNEVCFCNPSSSSSSSIGCFVTHHNLQLPLVNGKGPTNNEKKKAKKFYKKLLMIFNQSCSIMEEWKGVLNNDEKKKIFNYFIKSIP
jgi:hypothetical protein